jgi:general secretion pathway protein I
MKRRGFTLIEVLVSLAIFALAAVSLGAAYSNVILGRIALQQDEQRLDDIARCRAALMETPGFDDVETGGEIHLPGDRTARWKGKIEATAVSDLFAVQLTCEIQAQKDGDFGEEINEARMLLRPTWSIPSDRQKIRDDARQRLEKERGYKEADGNSAFISAPTRGKKLVPGQSGATGKGQGGGKGETGGKGQGGKGQGGQSGNGQPAKGGQPGGQPAARPAKR